MAEHGRDSDDDDWEEASYIFIVRSEAGGSEPDVSEDRETDDESGTLRVGVPPVPPRREPPANRNDSQNGGVERGRSQGTDRIAVPRPSTTMTPQSAYQLAPPPPSSRRRDLTKGGSPVHQFYQEARRPSKPYEGRPFIKPPKFEGKDCCIESHLAQFEIISKRNRWDDFEKADFLKCSLIGEASRMLCDLPDSATYDDVVFKLRQRYGSLEQIESYRIELKQRKRKPGESLSTLLKDIRRLFMMAYPGPPSYMVEITARDAFIDALNDRELMIKVMEREPNTLDQAFKIAERMELYQKIPEDRESGGRNKVSGKVRGTVVNNDAVLQSIVETQKLMQKQLTTLSDAIKERPSTLRGKDEVKAPSSKLKGVCHHCHKPGHYRPECPERTKTVQGALPEVPAAARTITAQKGTSAADDSVRLKPLIATQDKRQEYDPSTVADSRLPRGRRKHLRSDGLTIFVGSLHLLSR